MIHLYQWVRLQWDVTTTKFRLKFGILGKKIIIRISLNYSSNRIFNSNVELYINIK